MTHDRPIPPARLPWGAILLAALAITALYLDALRTPFLNDDYLFLEEARSRGLWSSLSDLGPLGNYYRPLARQIYFAVLSPVADGRPLLFHVVNYALFLAALALLADWLRTFLPRAGVIAGVLYFALLPLQRVNLMWVSCSQDLLALAGALAALAAYRRDRTIAGLLCFAAALASKESALPLPALLAAHDRWIAGRGARDALRRAAPFAALSAGWMVLALWMRARHAAAAPLDFAPAAFLAGAVHMVQALLGLDHPPGFWAALASRGPALVPLALLAVLALRHGPASVGAKDAGPTRAARALVGFAVLWMVAFAIPAGPVSYSWSSYYYTLAGVGAALLVGLSCARADRWALLALVGGLAWWHAAATGTAAFAVRDSRWVWTSHLTPFYFQRAAALTDTLSRQLRRLVPEPEPGSRFFFATLPSWAGFQMGNGALIRALYRDPTLASHFYSQFDESTAEDRPCHFLWWSGRDLAPLYDRARDRFFQVGSDLLLLDRPDGASAAFLRGLGEGGEPMDHLYWLGWAELWRGRRDRAEAAWTRFGATDDSSRWRAHLRAAHNALLGADTLEGRRHLAKAIEFGIGRPEAHAVLGELMLREAPKYGLMELKVAAWLNPRDWITRRDLAIGLLEVRLEDAARRELESLVAAFPELKSDSVVARARRTLQNRSGRETRVVEIQGG